jgi:hypothetical protein
MRRIALSVFIGLVVGLGVGVTIGWVIAPVQFVDSPMRDLSKAYKDDYTVMVAKGFQIHGDVNEATNRLKPLGVAQEFNVFTFVRDVTERYISEEGSGREVDIRALVELSCAMGFCTEPMQRFRRPVVPANPAGS